MSEQTPASDDRLSRRPGVEEPKLAPHVKEGSPEWQRLYEAVSAAARRDRAGVASKREPVQPQDPTSHS